MSKREAWQEILEKWLHDEGRDLGFAEVKALRDCIIEIANERDALKARIEGSERIWMPRNLKGIVGMDPDDTEYYAVPVSDGGEL
jgi:hypothetical protein